MNNNPVQRYESSTQSICAILFGRRLAFVRFMKDGRLGSVDKNLNWVEGISKARIPAKSPMFIYRMSAESL